MALERIEPDGSPTRPFPPHLRNTGQGWSTLTVYEGGFSSVVRRAPALPTAPSARSGVPVKHPAKQQSPDDEPQELVSGATSVPMAGATSVPIVPLLELDTKRLVSSKVSYTSLPRASLCTIVTRPPARRSVVDRPATGINHPRRNRAVRYALQFQWAPYVQLIFRIASCESHTYHQPAIATGP